MKEKVWKNKETEKVDLRELEKIITKEDMQTNS